MRILASLIVCGMLASAPALARSGAGNQHEQPGLSGTMGTKESGASLNPPDSPYNSYGAISSGPVATGRGGASGDSGCSTGAPAGRATEGGGATAGGCAPGHAGYVAPPR